MEQYFADLFVNTVGPWSGRLALAVLIFVVGRWLSAWAVGLLRTMLRGATLDETLVGFVSSIAHALLLLAIAIAALGQLGVDTTALIALVGAAGLAIGLALKDSLANFAAGFMLIVFRPFRVGDSVEVAEVTGVVAEIDIFSTKINTFDNKAVFIPNGEIYKGTIVNYSANPTRRLDLVIGIDYADDVAHAKQVLDRLLAADRRIHQDPTPVIGVSALADSAVHLDVRVWLLGSDYLAVKFALLETIKQAFEEEDIAMPYPQLAVHMVEAA